MVLGMPRIRHVDCGRTEELKALKGDYVALRDVDPGNGKLTFVALDEDEQGMIFSDAYFERFAPGENPDEETIDRGRREYRSILRAEFDAVNARNGGRA